MSARGKRVAGCHVELKEERWVSYPKREDETGRRRGREVRKTVCGNTWHQLAQVEFQPPSTLLHASVQEEGMKNGHMIFVLVREKSWFLKAFKCYVAQTCTLALCSIVY